MIIYTRSNLDSCNFQIHDLEIITEKNWGDSNTYKYHYCQTWKDCFGYVSMRVGNLKPNMEHIYVCLSLRDCSHKIYRFDAKREVSLLTLLLIPIFNLESTNVYVESIHSFQLTQRGPYKSYTIMSIMSTVCH